MPQDSRHSGNTRVQELVRAGSTAGSGSVNEGTVFVRLPVATASADSMWLDTEFHGAWLVLDNAAARGVEQDLADGGRSFSAGVAMEASAFGCDSKVLDRAVHRLLESAAVNSVDSVEITELRQHQDSGLDYVTILAVGRTILPEPPSEPRPELVGQGARLAAWQPEG